jgi:hypothetical protein
MFLEEGGDERFSAGLEKDRKLGGEGGKLGNIKIDIV